MPRQIDFIEEKESTFRTEDDTIPKAKPKSRAVEQPPDPMEGVKTTAPKKRVQTEKQKENFQKALGALKEKREAMKKAQEEEAEMLKAEKDELKIQEKQRERFEKSAAELQKFKLEMLDIVKPVKVVKEREVEVEKVVEKPVVVEKVVEKPMTKIISGNELLDRIFFNK
jgi:hypothetical protein